MRQTHLELYRWKLHNQIHVPAKHKYKKLMGMRAWWNECGAFVSILPRQSGKTTMLKTLVNSFTKDSEFYLIIVPSRDHHNYLVSNFNIPNGNIMTASSISFGMFTAISSMSNMHLLIDEFMYIKNDRISRMLDYDWKTVTMVSSLRY